MINLFIYNCKATVRINRPEVFYKKAVFRNFTKFTGKHLCQSQACNLIKKETLAQVFSCEFCEISKNTFFYKTPPTLRKKNCLTENVSFKEFKQAELLLLKEDQLVFKERKYKLINLFDSLNLIEDSAGLLKELRNRILRIIPLWSLFCSVWVYVSLHFPPILLEN